MLPFCRCFGSGYEFEGLGAKQVARGGAAVADSDDWTAIYWNPGNLVRASRKNGREIGAEAFGGMAYMKDSNSLSSLNPPGAIFSKQSNTLGSVLGALGGVVPIGDKSALGFGFYMPLMQGTDFKDTSPAGDVLDTKGLAGIMTWNVSFSREITQEFAAGAGVNLLYGKFKSDTTLILPAYAPFSVLHSKLDADGFGLEGTFGLRYDPHPQVSLGAVYRTGGQAPLKGHATVNPALIFPAESSRFEYHLRQPPTTGLGVCYRPREEWTLTFDFDQTYWKSFRSSIDYKNSGTLLTDTANAYHWRNTWKVRLGAQYGLTERTKLLGGYSFDRPAVDAGSLDLATTLDVPMHRFSGGVVHRWGHGLETSLGAVGGSGSRKEGSVSYRLSGWQAMGEMRLAF